MNHPDYMSTSSSCRGDAVDRAAGVTVTAAELQTIQQAMAAARPGDVVLLSGVDGAVLKTAADVPALARLIGCDHAALSQSLDAVNQSAQTQRPDALGRQFKRRLEGPFYAIKVTGALFHTQGGLDIDAQCRVLSKPRDATPADAASPTLPNLWAAGGAARGVSGNHVSGYLSGNGLLSAVAGAYIAAQSMADQLSHPI